MDPKFIKRDANGNVRGWRFYGEARSLIGQANLDKLRAAGLCVMPSPAADEELGRLFAQAQRHSERSHGSSIEDCESQSS